MTRTLEPEALAALNQARHKAGFSPANPDTSSVLYAEAWQALTPAAKAEIWRRHGIEPASENAV